VPACAPDHIPGAIAAPLERFRRRRKSRRRARHLLARSPHERRATLDAGGRFMFRRMVIITAIAASCAPGSPVPSLLHDVPSCRGAGCFGPPLVPHNGVPVVPLYADRNPL
jgi:hypothetical protein